MAKYYVFQEKIPKICKIKFVTWGYYVNESVTTAFWYHYGSQQIYEFKYQHKLKSLKKHELLI